MHSSSFELVSSPDSDKPRPEEPRENTRRTCDESGSATLPTAKPPPLRNPVSPPIRNPVPPRKPGQARKRTDEDGSPERSAVLPPANPNPAAKKECNPPCLYYRYLMIERRRKANLVNENKQIKSTLHATRHTLEFTQRSLEKAKAQIVQLKKAAQESKRSDKLRAKAEMAQIEAQERQDKMKEGHAKRQHKLDMEALKSDDQRVAESQMKQERVNKVASVAGKLALEAIKAQRKSPNEGTRGLPKSKSLPARHYQY